MTKTSPFLYTPVRFLNSAQVENSLFPEVKWESQYTEATSYHVMRIYALQSYTSAQYFAFFVLRTFTLFTELSFLVAATWFCHFSQLLFRLYKKDIINLYPSLFHHLTRCNGVIEAKDVLKNGATSFSKNDELFLKVREKSNHLPTSKDVCGV